MSDWRVLDLFSGIGGFSLGLERAGMRTEAFCENDGYARRVLRKHWPTAWIYDDVQTLTVQRLKKDGLSPNIICGGFPCQDISSAGKGRGLQGKRSGLWKHMHRLIREIRPRVAIMENVAMLRSRGLDQVVGDLATIGYDAEWHCISAAHIGAPHRRDRIWIVAYPSSQRRQGICPEISAGQGEETGEGMQGQGVEKANFAGHLRQGHGSPLARQIEISDAIELAGRKQWSAESRPIGVVDGVPYRLDRLRCCGNAVVSQLVERIGRAIIANAHLLGDPPEIHTAANT